MGCSSLPRLRDRRACLSLCLPHRHPMPLVKTGLNGTMPNRRFKDKVERYFACEVLGRYTEPF